MNRPYLSWDEQTISDFSEKNINSLYSQGYLFTRLGRGVMQQTRSVRVDLSKFELSSENRRILRKTEDISYTLSPIPYPLYSWEIGKMGKDFYSEKFGEKTFSANKIKELMIDETKSNFNILFVYTLNSELGTPNSIGYCIALKTDEILHYCYPFYELGTRNKELKDTGLGMMTRAIVWAKENGKKYVYLGSAQRPTDTYKFQFSGAEWFDGKVWKSDVGELKSNI